MTRKAIRLTVALTTAALLAGGVAACSTGGGDDGGKVTITVGNRPPTSEKESRTFFDQQVKAFEKKYPDITLKTSEVKYDPTSFQAQLAGGKLPDVLQIPFTDIQGLIADGQVADMTSAIGKAGYADELSKKLAPIGQADGKTYGIPVNAYSLSLVYNRDLFTKAGLDPDAPPTTWDEVRADAKAITEKTGVPGFGQMSTKNTGGWMFTGITYSYGGRIENSKGTKTAFTDGPSADALATLHDMRWTDGSVATNALFDYDGINQAFASGKIGMFIGAPDMYWSSVVNNKMDKQQFGVAGMPQADGKENGTLAGGAVEIVDPKASDGEKLAAARWIDWFYLRQYRDQKVAVDNVKATAKAGGAAGLPGLSILSDAAQERYNGWIKPYATVPLQNYQPYLDATTTIPLVPEPKTNAQDVYAALDSVIQAVLTDQNADIDTLLSDASKQLDAKLTR